MLLNFLKNYKLAYQIKYLNRFATQLKKLAKKYVSIPEDYSRFLSEVSEHPATETELFANCYKIPIHVSRKNNSKRSGTRVITYIFIAKENVYLLTIYDKSDQENISKQELRKLIESIDF